MYNQYDDDRRGGWGNDRGYNGGGRRYDDDRRGYNNDRNYRDNRRYDDRGRNDGYRGGSYGRGRRDDMGFDPRNGQFKIGDEVILIQTGETMRVINYGREQYECRRADLSSQYFYEHEIKFPDDDGE